MFVTWQALNWKQQATALCIRGLDRWLKRLWGEEAYMSMVVEFEAYGRSLDMVTAFKCLGVILMTLYYDCSAVVLSLRKEQKRWEWLSRILG